MDKYQMAINLIVRLEGVKLNAYYDTRIPPKATIGCGTTIYPNGYLVCIGDTCTLQQAQQYLNSFLQVHVYPGVDHLCLTSIVPDQVYAALCSIAYNEGPGILSQQSFVDAVKHENWSALADVFRMYTKVRVNGILTDSAGLINRREIEIAFFQGF